MFKPIAAMLTIALFFLISACVVDRHTLKMDMCKSTVKHYERASDDIEAKAYYDHYMDLCHPRKVSK